MRRAAVVVVLSTALVASAQEARPVRVDYDAPASCPDRARFVARVRARTPRVTIADDASTTLRARITLRDRGFAGEIALVEGGHETQRRVAGESCAEVVEALALIAAVAVDATASTATNPLESVVESARDAGTEAGTGTGTGTDAGTGT